MFCQVKDCKNEARFPVKNRMVCAKHLIESAAKKLKFRKDGNE